MNKSVVIFFNHINLPMQFGVTQMYWGDIFHSPNLYEMLGIPRTFRPDTLGIFDNTNQSFKEWLTVRRLKDTTPFFMIEDQYLSIFFDVIAAIETAKSRFGNTWWEEYHRSQKVDIEYCKKETALLARKRAAELELIQIGRELLALDHAMDNNVAFTNKCKKNLHTSMMKAIESCK